MKKMRPSTGWHLEKESSLTLTDPQVRELLEKLKSYPFLEGQSSWPVDMCIR